MVVVSLAPQFTWYTVYWVSRVLLPRDCFQVVYIFALHSSLNTTAFCFLHVFPVTYLTVVTVIAAHHFLLILLPQSVTLLQQGAGHITSRTYLSICRVSQSWWSANCSLTYLQNQPLIQDKYSKVKPNFSLSVSRTEQRHGLYYQIYAPEKQPISIGREARAA